MHEIKYGPENNWNPKYGDIDWYPMYEEYMESMGENTPEPLFLHTETYHFQLTEENSFVYFNRVAQQMNAVAIVDPIDNCAWWWFEDTHEDFEDLVEMVGPSATIINSDIPGEIVVKNYLRQILKDIVSVEYVPEEWENEGNMDG